MMLHGAQYRDGIEAGKPATRDFAHASGITHGLGKALELIGSLASASDPVPTGKPEHKLSDEEKLFQSWKP